MLASLSFLLASAPAAAQTAPVQEGSTGDAVEPQGQDDARRLDAVVVTGSNIRRADIEQIVPITVITPQQMAVRNALLPAD